MALRLHTLLMYTNTRSIDAELQLRLYCKTVHVVREAKGTIAPKIRAYHAVLCFARSVQDEILFCYPPSSQTFRLATLLSSPLPPGRGFLVPGREITKRVILIVTPLTFRTCDWSILPMEALLR